MPLRWLSTLSHVTNLPPDQRVELAGAAKQGRAGFMKPTYFDLTVRNVKDARRFFEQVFAQHSSSAQGGS